MDVEIGTEGISEQQKMMLDRARGRPTPRLVESLLNVSHDDDILEGREELHPAWVELFESNKSFIERYASPGAYQHLVSFFWKLSPLDASLRAIDPGSLNLTFILGAGASKPKPSDIPTVRELLPQLLERARRLDREDLTKLAEFCERRKIDNIEDLLTAAQLSTFCSRNPTVLSLMNYLLYRGDSDERTEEFRSPYREGTLARIAAPRRPREPVADLSSIAFLQDTLQVLFGLLSSTMLPARPNSAHESIAKYVGAHPGSCIVTTNYDCCMDLALGNVGKDYVYKVGFANVDASPVKAGLTRLIKLHGSLNWYYCETCQEVQHVDIRQTVRDFLQDKSPYPVIGICKDCGGQRRGLLVPPLAMKFDVAPPLTPLLSEAESAFEKSDIIVVVGFSFAEADVYISRMLSKSMQTSTKQKVIVADPDYTVVDRLRLKFKASIPNFDPGRIIKMTGDCADLLPKFLKGELKAATRRSAKRRK